jgi:hypothetical protein
MSYMCAQYFNLAVYNLLLHSLEPELLISGPVPLLIFWITIIAGFLAFNWAGMTYRYSSSQIVPLSSHR